MTISQSSSIEHSEKQPPYNRPKRRVSSREVEDKLKLDTHDTLIKDDFPVWLYHKRMLSERLKSKSLNDPAGLFLNNSVPNTTIPDPVLHNLHTANNCNNCKKMETGKCRVHGYQMPYKEIDCEQWEYRGKKA